MFASDFVWPLCPVFVPPPPTIGHRGITFQVVRPSVNTYFDISLLSGGILTELATKIHHVKCRELLKRSSRSEMKGQGRMCTKCVSAITAEAYISTVCRLGSLVNSGLNVVASGSQSLAYCTRPHSPFLHSY